jgi:hypothetical protein
MQTFEKPRSDYEWAAWYFIQPEGLGYPQTHNVGKKQHMSDAPHMNFLDP